VQNLNLAAEGQILVVRGQDHLVRLFDLARGLQRGGDILTTGFHRHEFAPRVGVSPDGSRIATGSLDGVVRLWQTRHFLPQHTLAANPRVPETSLSRLRFETGILSSDGRMGLVGASSENTGGRLVAVSAWPLVATLRQQNLYHCVFSPNGNIIATAPNNVQFGGKTAVTLWDKMGRPRGLPLFQYRYINTLAFSPDSRTLAVGCVGGVYLWDVATARLRHFLRERSTAGDLAFSPDGTRLAVANVNGWAGAGAGVRLWDTVSGKPVGAFLAAEHPASRSSFFAVAFADSGQTLRIFDLITGKLHTLDAETGSAWQAPLALAPAEEAVFSAAGTALATSHSNGVIQQWDPATGNRAGALIELQQPATRLGYSPDGQVLAVACRDQSVRLWDVASCAPIGPPLLHQAGVLDLRFTPECDSLVTLTATGRLHTWPLPKPVADDPERMELWLRASGGVGLENDSIVLLDAETWRNCRDQLQQRWPEADPALHRPANEADWHAARARDADEDGNPFTVLWHLDRLIAMRPQDWQLPARQGLLYEMAGDLDLAESAYRTASQHAPAEALQEWRRHNAAASLLQKHWATALRHLDRLVAHGGEDWQVHADRATALDNLGQPVERDAARARAVQLGTDAAFLVPLAEQKAAQGEWPEAAELFARAAERGGLDVLDECHYAMSCLKAGDEAGYRRICTRLIRDLENDGPMTAAFRRGGAGNMLSLFRACLLRADAVPDWQPLLKLSDEILAVPMRESSLAQDDQLVQMRLDWLAARGGVLCRQGRYEEAITSLRECVSQEWKAGNDAAWVFLAVAHLRLGHKAEAGQCMDKVLPPRSDANFSWESLEIELLRPNVVELEKEISAPGKWRRNRVD
jgi:WD40 repeat protein/Flp pilus assembly protein TadD